MIKIISFEDIQEIWYEEDMWGQLAYAYPVSTMLYGEKYNQKIKNLGYSKPVFYAFMYKNEIGTIMIILYYLSFVHLGLQQKVYAKLRNKENNNELIDLLNNIHPFTEKYIYMTKYFGTGTLTLFKIIVIYWIQINYSSK